jgi:hypothetical protein
MWTTDGCRCISNQILKKTWKPPSQDPHAPYNPLIISWTPRVLYNVTRQEMSKSICGSTKHSELKSPRNRPFENKHVNPPYKTNKTSSTSCIMFESCNILCEFIIVSIAWANKLVKPSAGVNIAFNNAPSRAPVLSQANPRSFEERFQYWFVKHEKLEKIEGKI